MQPGTFAWAVTWIGLLAAGMGLCFAGSRLLYIPGVWPAAIPIALCVLIIIAYGWHAGTLRFHAIRAANVAASAIVVLILVGCIMRDSSPEILWLIPCYLVSMTTVPELRSQSDIEGADKAPPSKWQKPMEYAAMALGIGLTIFFVVQALHR